MRMISNRVAYTLIVFGILVLFAIGINAYQSGGPPNIMGHSAEELDLSGGVNGYAIFNDRVGIGTSNPYATLHVKGQAFIDSLGTSAIIGFGDHDNSDAGIIGYDVDNNYLFLRGKMTGLNALHINYDGNVGIGISTPNSKLEVNGEVDVSTLIANSSLVAKTVQGSIGIFQEAQIENLIFENLLINQSQFIMRGDTGGATDDYCTVTMTSSRGAASSGPGSLNIICVGPSGVCGNYIVESSNGEECEPPNSYVWEDEITGSSWDCQTGNPYTSFFHRARINCDSNCQYALPVYCECKAKCLSLDKEWYFVYFDCYTTTPSEACASGDPSGP